MSICTYRPLSDNSSTTIDRKLRELHKYLCYLSPGSSSSGLTVGTTTIASGTTTRILYDNAGTLGEYTITGTGTVVAMQTSPSFITSVIGGASFDVFNTISTTLNFAGAATTLNIGASAAMVLNFGGGATAAEFRFLEPSGSGTNYSAFKAVAQSASITYSLPPAVGAVNTFLTDAAGNGVLSWVTESVTPTNTTTFTNKRWTARVGSTTSSATPTINTDVTDIYKLTAQTADITSFTTNLSGTPVDGDVLEIQITGTAARALTFGTSFVAGAVSLPTTTVTTVTLTVIFHYYVTSSYGANKWVCVNYF